MHIAAFEYINLRAAGWTAASTNTPCSISHTQPPRAAISIASPTIDFTDIEASATIDSPALRAGMHNFILVTLGIGAGIWQWAADGKARALANRKVLSPSSNAPTIEDLQYVHHVETELARRLDSLAGLHSTLFESDRLSPGFEAEVTTSRSVKLNTTLSNRLSSMETLLKGVPSGIETDDNGHIVIQCELKSEDKLAISNACRRYQVSADYDWHQMRDHILTEESLYERCAEVVFPLQEWRIRQYHTTISNLRTALQALALAIDAEQQSIDRDRETAYHAYDASSETAALDRHKLYVALAAILSRRRDLEVARRVSDVVLVSLAQQHVGAFGAKCALDGAMRQLGFMTGHWSDNWDWIELHPCEVVEHLQRLIDAGLEVR